MHRAEALVTAPGADRAAFDQAQATLRQQLQHLLIIVIEMRNALSKIGVALHDITGQAAVIQGQADASVEEAKRLIGEFYAKYPEAP